MRTAATFFADAAVFSDRLESLGRQHFVVLWLSFVVGGTELDLHSALLGFRLHRAQISSRKRPFSFDLTLRYSAEILSEQGVILDTAGILESEIRDT